MLQISKPALQNYEAGRRMPPGEMLIRAAGIGETTVDWILCGRDSRNNRRGTFVTEDSLEFEILMAVRSLPKGRKRLALNILKAILEEE